MNTDQDSSNFEKPRDIHALLFMAAATAEQLGDKLNSRYIQDTLQNNGTFDNGTQCTLFARLLARRARGESVPSSLSKLLAEAGACLAQWGRLATAKNTALGEFAKLSDLWALREKISKNIADEIYRRDQISEWIKGAADSYQWRTAQMPENGFNFAIAHADGRLSGQAAVLMINDEVLPKLNKELDETEKQIAEHSAAIGMAASSASSGVSPAAPSR